MPDWIIAMGIGAVVIYGLLIWFMVASYRRNKEEEK
jgi:uncharacterized membrane protein YqiK